MSGLVLDASVSGWWALEGGAHARASALLDLVVARGAAAPWNWWFESRNLLTVQERRGVLTREEAAAQMEALMRLRIAMDGEPDAPAIAAMARRHRLTFYDAAYLELAARKRLPLASFDDDLLRAARAEGIALIE